MISIGAEAIVQEEISVKGVINSKYTELFFKNILIKKAHLQREGKIERQIFHVLEHSSGSHNGKSLADLESGTRNLLWISYIDARFPRP